jgi:hypothetical protein
MNTELTNATVLAQSALILVQAALELARRGHTKFEISNPDRENDLDKLDTLLDHFEYASSSLLEVNATLRSLT